MIGGLNLLQELNNMQPYQKASQALRKSGESPINIAKNAGLTLAGGAVGKLGLAAGASLLPRIKSLINEFVPDNIMEKGLEKIDPRFGKFINGAKKAGFDSNEIRNFVGEKTNKTETQNQKNIIEMESPELHQFIDQEIKKGRDVIQAGALAQNNKKFTKIISKLTKDHKTPWSSILQSVYGMGQTAQKAPEQGIPVQDMLAQQGQQQPQQDGQGISDEQILSAIANALKL